MTWTPKKVTEMLLLMLWAGCQVGAIWEHQLEALSWVFFVAWMFW